MAIGDRRKSHSTSSSTNKGFEVSGPALKRAKNDVLKKVNGANPGKFLLPKDDEDKKVGERVVVVLEKCFLELVQIKKGQYELLNSDDHKTTILKSKDKAAQLAEARPDITHQCLMTLLDSPLNKKGKLLIYIHTHNNVLIEVHPSLRVPRTFKRFCGLMVELLQKNKIRAAQTNELLMRVISNPIDKYLPPGGHKVGLSVSGESVDMRDFCALLAGGAKKATNGSKSETSEASSPVKEAEAEEEADDDTTTTVEAHSREKKLPITFVVGGVAHCDPVIEPQFGADYVEKKISISEFGLSASCVCSKICHEFEHLWNV